MPNGTASSAWRRWLATKASRPTCANSLPMSKSRLPGDISTAVEQEIARAALRPTPPAPRQTVKIGISNSGSPKESILRWFVELDTAIGARRLDEAAMQTLEAFKLELRAAFEPPENEFCTRLQFLSLRQGTQDMHGYVQRARMLLVSILADPVDQQTQLAVFIAGCAMVL
ncbi:TPA: hypothetical protein N0F65_011740 [Lagenidium giganteum]|uniref:Retrotransposon gag domain-containing protein n=1 Tax=Lagenidium giganteum TaxID=4803 RepID=A0AAV2YJJ3_9STRA|nr:TPA: hypothetical protein N0F65_011740 [Lagenidium giganteum]